MKILIADAFAEDLPARLARHGKVSVDPADAREADVVLVRSKTRCDRAYIDAAPSLKMIIRGGVGLDNIDLEYARQKGIAVHNTASASSIAVAEHALAMMLAMPNHIVRAHETMRAGQWAKKELKRSELRGKTLGLIGAGRIATEVARRAAVFGMEIMAFDPFVSRHDLAEMTRDLPTLLAGSHYLSLHVPLTRETEGMIDAARIALMQDGVYLVNTARGQLVVEQDMREALEQGKVAGYATDVWYQDPPENSPLIDAPNMLMTPHIGASTAENLGRIGDRIVELVAKFVAENETTVIARAESNFTNITSDPRTAGSR